MEVHAREAAELAPGERGEHAPVDRIAGFDRDVDLLGGLLVLARMGNQMAPEGLDRYFTDLESIEEEASRELREKGLCGSSVKLATPVERTANRGITAIFKCRPTAF